MFGFIDNGMLHHCSVARQTEVGGAWTLEGEWQGRMKWAGVKKVG